MEGVVAIGQQPAHITNLETLQANSTIHEAAPASLCCCLLVHKARKVFKNVVSVGHSLPVVPLLSTFLIVVPSEGPPHDADMDNHQNRYPHKQYDQRNHNLHLNDLALFTFTGTQPSFPSILEGSDSDKICMLLGYNKLKLGSNNHRLLQR
ncbi:unnamed protein product [Sphenostylis stenocarpa]|uniref:Uncharacterized protein n=1 Tax=Sphenostylis stenocarpa TaxID=92480 RepID=A0AA86VTX3_9FABA|nr:unnamed protein product [Sphenostylis stenocarpa]